MHENAPNCTILEKILWRACPRSPLAKRMGKIFLTLPLPNPGYAPHPVSADHYHSLSGIQAELVRQLWLQATSTCKPICKF